LKVWETANAARKDFTIWGVSAVMTKMRLQSKGKEGLKTILLSETNLRSCKGCDIREQHCPDPQFSAI